MPVSADLLKVLAEDPKALEQQLGCMTGLFQIFDRQGLGRRYGSKRVSNAGSGQSQPTSACETPRHDHRSSNPYWMFEDDTSQRISGDSFDRGPKNGAVESTREHHLRAYSDSSEIFTKSFETPTESRTSPDEKSQVDQSSMYSEESVGGLAFYYNDPSREGCAMNSATSSYPSVDDHELSAEHCKKLNVVVPARANPSCNKDHPAQSSSDIRDIVRASFDRDHQRTRADFCSAKEKPRLSMDGSHSQQGYLKNLPRSSSVDGRDRLRLSVDGRVDTGATPRQPPADLPRSSSVGGRGASRMLADWKDGLRNSGGSPRLTSKEKEILKQTSELLRNSVDNRSIAKYQSSADARDATRLTVELKEGPRLSVSVDDRRASVDGKVSPRPISRFRETCERPSTTTDFKESLRAADIKEFLRGSQKATREGHRFSVDGTRDAPRACIAPRLSVDGRDSANSSSTLVPRKLKLDRAGLKESNDTAHFCRQSSGRGDVDAGDLRRKAPNVVARLMGLDELPSSKEQPLPVKVGAAARLKETDPHQEFLQCHPRGGSPPPPPSPPDDYDYAHRSSDHEDLHHWQKRAGGQRVRRSGDQSIHDHFSSKHQLFTPEIISQSSALQFVQPSKDMSPEDDAMHVVKQSTDEDVHLDQKDQRQVRKSPQGRRSLWHIFEAMQLKSLLNGSSRRKQAEALRLHNLKMTEEKECQELKTRSQSLPPRLSSTSKDHSVLDYQDTPRVLSLPLNHGSAAYPKALEHKGSGLEDRQATTLEADRGETCVMVKPIIIRSLSYRSQPATALVAPSQPCGKVPGISDDATKFIPDGNTTPKNISRGLSKNVAYNRAAVNEMPQEPLQAADSSYSHNSSSSANGGIRQSRKERGAARMAKSFSDVPLSERDSSPRGPRAHTNTQEKPTRSCSPRGDSSSVSPRCPGSVEGMRLMEAGKVRRKAIAVKDREETKASLANLRANATKQEFLKGRASGDPDTPRLRRSSSESRLLSKIAEKPTTTDVPATKAPAGGRSAAPNMTLLRSKRQVSKDNISPLKTRPTSALSLKSVAKTSSPKQTVAFEHINRKKSVCNGVPESTSMVAQEQQPAESKPPGVQASSRCSLTEVRATQGGALDHSGDTTHSNTREQRTESKAREKTIEIDEGVKTPRGVSIKKIDFSEDAQAEVAEQPSPVSVLDNSHFDEELTPSPKAGKSSVISLQDSQSLRAEKDRRWSSARFLDLDLEDSTSSTALLKVSEAVNDSLPETDSAISREKTESVSILGKNERAIQVPLIRESVHRHTLRVCLKDADEEKTYVEELVEASSLGSGCSSPDLLSSSTNYVMDPSIFDQLETKRSHFDTLDDEKDILDRRILFDCVNEVLERLLETQVSCMRWTGLLQPSLRKRPMGQQLVKEVFVELEDIPCAASEDVCDTVYVILQKDLVKGRGQQWSDYNKELEEVGVAVERMIVKDLIDETVRELSVCLGQNPLAAGGASRRQLFA